MRVINWLVIILLFVFWLAEDEMVEIENSISEGEFEMEEQIVAQGMLDERAEAVYQIYADGDIALANSLGEIALNREQAYQLLEVLYQHRDRLRGAQDTVPLVEEPDPLVCQCCGKDVAWSSIPPYTEISEPLFVCAECQQEQEQWQASGTCQLDEAHTGRDVFRCDGCECMACNECGELMEDVWLCEACLMPREPIMAHPF